MPRKSLHPHSASSRSVQCFFPFHFSPWLGSCPVSCHLVAPVLAPLLPPPRLALQPRLPRPPSDSPLVPAETDLLVGGRGLLLQSRESTLPALSGTGLWSSVWEPRDICGHTRLSIGVSGSPHLFHSNPCVSGSISVFRSCVVKCVCLKC